MQDSFEKGAAMITISFDTNSGIPMYRQIYDYIKKEILAGNLSHPEKLPSARSLAAFLQVSRSTVNTAYDQLVAEGYIEPREKRGYFVNPITHTQNFTETPAPTVKAENKSDYSIVYDFNPDAIDTLHFPYSVWKSLGKNEMDNPDNFLLGNRLGELPLREAIAGYLHGSRGVVCSPDNIIVGAGLDHLLQMLCILFQRKAVIAMESPGYRSARQVFVANGCRVEDIPLLDGAFDVQALSLSQASICYVTPSHQFPLGSVMGISRRQKLLSWTSEEGGRYIIEDDHDSEFRYRGKPIPALQSLDKNQRVIYIGTLSKAISPAIRTGYMVLPDSLMKKYPELCGSYSCPVSRISQAVLTAFIRGGYFEKHLNRMRKIYKCKHDFMMETLQSTFPENLVTLSADHAGLYIILRYHGSRTEDEITESAEKSGIRLRSLRGYYTKVPAGYKPAFLLGFANMEESQIKKGITLLAKEVLLP